MNDSPDTTTKANEPQLCLQDVCCAYDGVPVLSHLSASISPGETICLTGPNGAGKSTLLKLLNGLIFPEQGTYLFEGTAITASLMRDHRYSKWFHQRVSFLWQNPDTQLFCSTVTEELAFGPIQMGLPSAEVRQRVDDALQALSIAHLRDRAPYSLSGGEKKRVALASLLTMNPAVWTMDEPESFLDAAGRAWLMEFLQALQRAGKTLIMATHDRELLQAFGQHTLALTPASSARQAG